MQNSPWKVQDFLHRKINAPNIGTDEERRNGVDIADVLVRWILERQTNVTPEAPEQPPSVLYADNPVMQEVMKYISPEYWDNVDALIREFDLELVSVTKLSK